MFKNLSGEKKVELLIFASLALGIAIMPFSGQINGALSNTFNKVKCQWVGGDKCAETNPVKSADIAPQFSPSP